MVYDGVLLTAVLFAATAVLLPFTGGQAIGPGQSWYPAYLVMVAFGYFGWFWTHGGQTLGMRTWNLRLVGSGRGGVSWAEALVRFVGAGLSWLALGMGFLWMLVDHDSQAWHDHLSRTSIVDAS